MYLVFLEWHFDAKTDASFLFCKTELTKLNLKSEFQDTNFTEV